MKINMKTIYNHKCGLVNLYGLTGDKDLVIFLNANFTRIQSHNDDMNI